MKKLDVMQHTEPVAQILPHFRPAILENDYQRETFAAVIAATIEALIEKRKAKSWQHRDIAAELETMRGALPNLFQARPTTGEVPTLPIDPVTGRQADNPYAKETLDLASQASLELNLPELAGLLKLRANGITYKIIFDERRDAAARKEVAEFIYHHAANPFRGSLSREKAIEQRAIEIKNPLLAAFLARESRTDLPVSPYGPVNMNLSEQGRLESNFPEFSLILSRASEIHLSWIQDELFAEKEKADAAAKAVRDAEAKLLGR